MRTINADCQLPTTAQLIECYGRLHDLNCDITRRGTPFFASPYHQPMGEIRKRIGDRMAESRAWTTYHDGWVVTYDEAKRRAEFRRCDDVASIDLCGEETEDTYDDGDDAAAVRTEALKAAQAWAKVKGGDSEPSPETYRYSPSTGHTFTPMPDVVSGSFDRMLTTSGKVG